MSLVSPYFNLESKASSAVSTLLEYINKMQNANFLH